MTLDFIKTLDYQMERKGTLLLVWGWINFFHFLIGYLLREMVLSFQIEDLLNLISYALIPIGLLITVVYLIKNKLLSSSGKVKTVTYIWVGLIISLVMINLIEANVLGKINFEFQHPVFMVIIGTSISLTGRVMSYPSLMIGGILFLLLGGIASYFPLSTQMLIEAVGWGIAFLIPGYIIRYQPDLK